MQLIRGSELQSFLRCRKRWAWEWMDGYKAKKQDEKLSIGILIHKFLEVYYTTGSSFYAHEAMANLYMKSSEIEHNDDMYALAMKVCNNYSEKYRDIDDFKVIATELTFAIPLDDDICYTGTIDLIYKQDGKLYFMDHKTTKSIEKYEKNAVMDRQISRYWWALQQLSQGKGYILVGDTWVSAMGDEGQGSILTGGKPAGFVYNIILKDYPQPPKVLKNGSISKDKSQNTTFEIYRKALDEAGITEWIDGEPYVPAEYKDILQFLKDSPREYFKRVDVFRNQAEIDASMDEFYVTVRDMEFANVYRNITQDCSWDCQFKDVCLAGMDGSNVEHLLSTQFTKEELKNEYHGLRN